MSPRTQLQASVSSSKGNADRLPTRFGQIIADRRARAATVRSSAKLAGFLAVVGFLRGTLVRSLGFGLLIAALTFAIFFVFGMVVALVGAPIDRFGNIQASRHKIWSGVAAVVVAVLLWVWLR